MPPSPRLDPRLYLVTDPALGGEDLPAKVEAAVRGGATLVQLRDKQAADADLLALARRLRAVLAPFRVPLLINDRVETALAAAAEGVHLGQSDMPVAEARRRLGPRAIIGLSLERIDDLAGADPALLDYVAASPVFQTATKADIAPPLGLDGLATLRRATALPLVAIGGIHAGNAAQVIEAGADGIAVVSAILAAPAPADAAADLRRTVDAALALRRQGRKP